MAVIIMTTQPNLTSCPCRLSDLETTANARLETTADGVPMQWQGRLTGGWYPGEVEAAPAQGPVQESQAVDPQSNRLHRRPTEPTFLAILLSAASSQHVSL